MEKLLNKVIDLMEQMHNTVKIQSASVQLLLDTQRKHEKWINEIDADLKDLERKVDKKK